jgi:iron complex outermembrane recepter protein
MFLPATAFAQSTGSVDFEKETIVVTGTRVKEVGGVQAPDTPKAKAVLTQEMIARQNPGQTVLDTINLVPGVSFQNNDAYGSSGGTLTIRGFDSSRISLTFDGIQLNDSGNYAIYSNQQMDPELIEQVNVNLGTTDVDSPTASAAGGTVNYRTRIPRRELGGMVNVSMGSFDYKRVFAMLETGEFTPFGTRAFISGSIARNDKFRGPGEIYKRQVNARLYQDIGDNGDFVSISGHFNRNRNNFYRNPSINDLRSAAIGLGPVLVTNANASAANPIVIGKFADLYEDNIFNFENEARCSLDVRQTGVADNDASSSTTVGTVPGLAPSTCTNFHDLRINPSDTGNVRVNSRFTLMDNLILTVDPSYQYVLANGGGTTTLAENSVRARGGTPTAPGVDFSGDGDFLDTVRFYTPNNTNTHRIGLTASLIYDLTEQHRFRVAYTYDRGRHRQTGEWGFLDPGGRPLSVFGGRNSTPVRTADGFQFQQRDRLSIALLHQIAGQYIGKFMDNNLRVEIGLRMPFFERDLEQRCYTEARGSGFAYCTSEPVSTLRIIGPSDPVPATGPTPYYAPFTAKYKFSKLLPNVGLTYRMGDLSVFGSYAKGFSAPRTDNLYRAPIVTVDPESTDAFDLGARYTNNRIQAQATAWMINYKNRIVSSFNPDLGISIDRNVGKVESRGFDASLAFKPIRPVTLYAFGSWIDAELKENVQIGTLPAGITSCGNSETSVPTGCAATAGKMVTETPEWSFGGRAQFEFGPVEFGIQGKWVDDRFATDVNDVLVTGYTTVDLDARISLREAGLENSFLQLNVINLFDTDYFGNISTQINAAGNPNFTVGAPRTLIGTVRIGF